MPRTLAHLGPTLDFVIVDSALYRRGQRIVVDCEIHEYDTLRAKATEDGDFVWVGLYKPTEAELADVAKAFGLHHLAVEDAVKAHQRPKLERYDDSLFLVLKTLWYVDEDDAVETGEINMFIGPRLRGHGPAREGLAAPVGAGLPRVAGGRPHPRALGGRLRRLRHGRGRLHRGRRRAADRRRRDRGVGLLARAHQRLGADLHPQARDRRGPPGGAAAARADAQVRRGPRVAASRRRRRRSSATSSTTSTRRRRSWTPWTRLLSTAFDAHLARISVQQNNDMRKISAGIGLVAMPTLIAGVYGMNFDRHARARLGLGLPVRAAADGAVLGRALGVLQEVGLVCS